MGKDKEEEKDHGAGGVITVLPVAYRTELLWLHVLQRSGLGVYPFYVR